MDIENAGWNAFDVVGIGYIGYMMMTTASSTSTIAGAWMMETAVGQTDTFLSVPQF